MSVALEHVDTSCESQHVAPVDLSDYQVSTMADVGWNWEVRNLCEVDDRPLLDAFVGNLPVARTQYDSHVKLLYPRSFPDERARLRDRVEILTVRKQIHRCQ